MRLNPFPGKKFTSLLFLTFCLCFPVALFSPEMAAAKETFLKASRDPKTRSQSPEALKQTDWWPKLQKQIQDEEYHITYQEKTRLPDMKGAYQAPNRAQNLRTYFTDNGINVVNRTETQADWHVGIALEAIGSSDKKISLPEAEKPVIKGSRIEYDRKEVVEWYENRHEGLEQGFTIKEKLNDAEIIEVILRISGDAKPVLSDDKKAIDFFTDSNARVLRYADLKVLDASGRTLSSWFELENDTVKIHVDSSKAIFPIMVDPLLSSPSWTVESNQASAWFGNSVSTAGDVNGDGYSDVIVGAPYYDNGETDEGKAFVYLGGSGGLSTTADWTVESNQASASFGNSVSTAGDVNGDGYSDVIVGASDYDNGETDEGKAFVYLGGSGGLSTTAAWTAESNQASAYFGNSVSTAGDVNGDGFSDIIVGAYYYDNGQAREGRAFVYLGGSGGPSATAAWTAEGNTDYAYYGCSVSTAGDVNGDGYSDIIVGAFRYGDEDVPQDFEPYEDDVSAVEEGKAYVYLGGPDSLSSIASWTAEGNQDWAHFGFFVSTAGDVNGDGYSDIIVGAPDYDNGETDEGSVFVFLGGAGGLSTSASWTAESNQANTRFGYRVSTAGDVNGDGYNDVIIGADRYDNGETDEGKAFVYLGSSAGLSSMASWTAESNQAFAYFGVVSGAGDVNGDGFSDIIIGANGYDNGQTDEGRAFVYLGGSDTLSTTAAWTAEADQASAFFGYSVSTVGDVNGDGYSDVIVGALNYDNGQTDEGKVFVYHGSSSGLSGTANWTAEGNQESAYFGNSVSTAGDVNGDGYSDVIIGVYYYDNGETDEGKAVVYHGSSSGLSGTANWLGEGNQASAYFGFFVSTAGDVNGDGYSDVIIGAGRYDNGETDEGKVFVYHGSSSGISGTANWAVEGNQEYACLGRSVSTAGDVNGDGYSDVIIGAYPYDNDQTNEGKVFVYHGSSSGLSATTNWTAEGNQDNAYFGNSVSTAGDVNGDGYSDVVIGAYSYDNGQTNEGKVFVHHGSSSGLSATANWTAEGNLESAFFGLSVSTAGDVNGDGYSDIIIGASHFSNGETEEGRVFVFHGSSSGVSTTTNWTAEGNQASAYFGRSVSTAGDVNGDGYSDIVIGSSEYDNGQTNEGKAFVYYGNGGRGLSIVPRQLKSDETTPISHLLHSDSETSFVISALGRSPLGRSKIKLEWEVKELGIPFDGAGTSISSQWQNTGTTGYTFKATASGLSAASSYHWRARFLYPAGNRDGCRSSRWFSSNSNAWSEKDLETPDLTPPSAPVVAGTTPTSDTTPTWTWTPGGGGNGTYRYKMDNSDLSSGATEGTGTSYTPGSPLSEASHTLYVQERDAAGNWSSSGSFAITVDATPPTAPAVSGTTPTSDTTPTWTWTPGGGGNGTYRYKLDNSDLSSGTTEGTGTSYTPGSPLSEASHTLYVQERDAAGNWSSSGSYAITVDAAPPTAPAVSGTTPTSDTTPTWTWTPGGGGNGTYRYKLDNSDLSSGATEGTGTSYTPGSALSEASHTLYVQERDAAGNWSSSGSFAITVDATPPTAPAVSGTTPTSDTTPTWTWTPAGGGNGTYRYKLDNSDLSSGATEGTGTSYTPGSALSESSHALYVQERDAAGNWSSSGSYAITVDATPPTAPAVSGTTPTSDTTPTWTWTPGGGGNGAYRYKLDNSDLSSGATEGTGTSYTPGSALSEGSHALYVQERDAAGNWSGSGSFAITVIIDNCPDDPDKIDPGICGCGIPDTDTDSDGTPNCNEECPDDPTKIVPGFCGCGTPDTDTDSDGIRDCADGCPNDPNKVTPGICGCGVADTDGDSDGTPNCNDECPVDPTKIAPGFCGCGTPDTDTDSDGTPNCADNCPDDPNKTASGLCGCGIADTDSDSDGTPDCNDITPPSAPIVIGSTPTNDTTPTWTWSSGDGGNGTYRYKLDNSNLSSGATQTTGTSYTPESTLSEGSHTLYVQERDAVGNWSGTGSYSVTIDITAPSVPNVSGSTPTNDTTPTWTWTPGGDGNGTYRYKLDNSILSSGATETTATSYTPAISLSEGSHTVYVQERDAAGNWSGSGSFAVTVIIDNCPDDPDKIDPGICGCGVPDTDTDDDGLADCMDNCLHISNAAQTDTDGDGFGNACDLCIGNDAAGDTDSDGDCNDIDTDDDDDGIPDAWEITHSLNPLDASDVALDLDGDGFTNVEEYRGETSPQACHDFPGRPEVVETFPHRNQGIEEGTLRVPHDTTIVVRIKDDEAIDADTISVDIKVNSVSVTGEHVLQQVSPDDPSDYWIVFYPESYFAWETQVDVVVNAKDRDGFELKPPYAYSFKIETKEENEAAQAAAPASTRVVQGDTKVLSADPGTDIEGAKIIYDADEPVEPRFRPSNEIPALENVVAAVGVPVALEPPMVLEKPAILIIPCPNVDDVSKLSVFYYKSGKGWNLACDSQGNVHPGGEGWMVPGSRVNHNETDPKTIEIRVLHLCAAQAADAGCFIFGNLYAAHTQKSVFNISVTAGDFRCSCNDNYYICLVAPGTYAVTASARGYETQPVSGIMVQMLPYKQDFQMVLEDNCPDDPHKITPGVCGCGTLDTDSDNDSVPDCMDPYPTYPMGDMGNDGVIDLSDAVSVFQFITGVGSPPVDAKKADVNGDEKVGTEEMLFILQMISGVR